MRQVLIQSLAAFDSVYHTSTHTLILASVKMHLLQGVRGATWTCMSDRPEPGTVHKTIEQTYSLIDSIAAGRLSR